MFHLTGKKIWILIAFFALRHIFHCPFHFRIMHSIHILICLAWCNNGFYEHCACLVGEGTCVTKVVQIESTVLMEPRIYSLLSTHLPIWIPPPSLHQLPGKIVFPCKLKCKSFSNIIWISRLVVSFLMK